MRSAAQAVLQSFSMFTIVDFHRICEIILKKMFILFAQELKKEKEEFAFFCTRIFLKEIQKVLEKDIVLVYRST